VRAAALSVLLCLGLAAAPPPYKPDPSKWRLELGPGLGGWVDASAVTLQVKLVDPSDPEPQGASLEPEEEEAPENETREQRQARWAAQRLRYEAFQRRNAWRDRALVLWFNGQERRIFLRVGTPWEERLECQGGENRLELLEPDSGLRAVRTWWAAAANTRFTVHQVRVSEEGPGGALEVIEPDGQVAASFRRTPSGGRAYDTSYTHPRPPAGTYTLRWTGIWRGARPGTVTLEAVLDAGTERERRWRFEKLLLPGAGPAVLGTVDVED